MSNPGNTLQQSSNELHPVNYKPLLEKIVTALQHEKVFDARADRLAIDVDKIAAAMADLPMAHPLGTPPPYDVTAATLHVSDEKAEDQLRGYIRRLYTHLRSELQAELGAKFPGLSVEQYVHGFVKDLSSFQKPITGLGFDYPFHESYQLHRQRLYMESNKPAREPEPLLKFHKLTITVGDAEQFQKNLEAGVRNYIQKRFAAAPEEVKEGLEETLQDMLSATAQDAEIQRLARLVDTETLGKLKKDAQIRYLEFLIEVVEAGKKANNGLPYLKDLARRLQLIDEYINDEEEGDGHYEVSYGGDKIINYRDAFARSDAFDMLPIVPQIKGYLGETTEESTGERRFTFGMKLKLNGKVTTYSGGQFSSFAYHLDLINPDGKAYADAMNTPFKAESFKAKLLRIVFLYYLVFRNFGQLDYDPLQDFKTSVLPVLKGTDQQAKEDLLRNVRVALASETVQKGLRELRTLLRDTLKRSSPERQTYARRVCLKKGILLNNATRIVTEGKFFNAVLAKNPREALKYISIEDPKATTTALCKLRVEMILEAVYYYRDDQSEPFQMRYAVDEFKMLPVLFTSREKICTEVYKRSYQAKKVIVIPHDHARREQLLMKPPSKQAFAYSFTFTLLIYLCLKAVLTCVQNYGKKLFIPLVRLHVPSKQASSPGESFMRSSSKVLAHLFSEEYLANAQGFYLPTDSFRTRNGLSSLYSVLPKLFTIQSQRPPTASATGTSSEYIQSDPLDKLAIIVVSSRVSDARRTSEQRRTNIMGEVISIERLDTGQVRLEILSTFSATPEDFGTVYTAPTVLKDEVEKCRKRGYTHILYIAQSPYSSTLHMTTTEKHEDLFFMSGEVIRFLKEGRSDLKLYPLFFDEYSVVKLQEPKVNSLYIQDVQELSKLVQDTSKKKLVFFNLFNGMAIPGNQDERSYRGVMSYTTLLNVYEGVLDNTDLLLGLIYPGSLKDDILNCLMFLHFSRYEAVPRGNIPISFKLDPYESIIGSDSVGPLSLFSHINSGAQFNSLAFLSHVRRIINVL